MQGKSHKKTPAGDEGLARTTCLGRPWRISFLGKPPELVRVTTARCQGTRLMPGRISAPGALVPFGCLLNRKQTIQKDDGLGGPGRRGSKGCPPR